MKMMSHTGGKTGGTFEAIFPNQTILIWADTAKKRTLAKFSWTTSVKLLVTHIAFLAARRQKTQVIEFCNLNYYSSHWSSRFTLCFSLPIFPNTEDSFILLKYRSLLGSVITRHCFLIIDTVKFKLFFMP